MRRGPLPARSYVAALLASSLIVAAGGSPAQAVPALKAVRVKTGLNGPSGFTFSPKGKIYYLERGTGEVHVLNPATGHDRMFFTISGVDGSGERGALGIALHPKFPARPFVFVYATRSTGGHLKNQIVRIRMDGGVGVGMKVLLSSPASTSPYHNGGRILFGPGGLLYAVVGDGHDNTNSQDLSANLRGKILRIRPDGGVPATNPFRTRVWAFGIRNSFGFTFDPGTRRLWETENGPSCNDEINRITKGGNFAWGPNESCGSQPAPHDTNNSGPAPQQLPKQWFVSTLGITGGAFCDGCGLGAAYRGAFLYGCVNDGEIRMQQMNAARTHFSTSPAIVLDTPNGAVHSIEVAPGGKIFFSDYQGIYRLARA